MFYHNLCIRVSAWIIGCIELKAYQFLQRPQLLYYFLTSLKSLLVLGKLGVFVVFLRFVDTVLTKLEIQRSTNVDPGLSVPFYFEEEPQILA